MRDRRNFGPRHRSRNRRTARRRPRLIAGRATPTPAEAERLSALASIAERLSRLVKPEHIAAWLATANPILGGDAPVDRIAVDDHGAVAKLVSGLEDPGAS